MADNAAFYEREYERLCGMLKEASEGSHLPDEPPASARATLDDLLLELRKVPV